MAIKETRETIGGLGSTRKPRYRYIPHCALDDLARRFEVGQERHGKNAMSALTGHEKITKEWVIARLEHVINHCMLAIEEVHRSVVVDPSTEGVEDNAGAIMFGGAILSLWNKKCRELEGTGKVNAGSSQNQRFPDPSPCTSHQDSEID